MYRNWDATQCVCKVTRVEFETGCIRSDSKLRDDACLVHGGIGLKPHATMIEAKGEHLTANLINVPCFFVECDKQEESFDDHKWLSLKACASVGNRDAEEDSPKLLVAVDPGKVSNGRYRSTGYSSLRQSPNSNASFLLCDADTHSLDGTSAN